MNVNVLNAVLFLRCLTWVACLGLLVGCQPPSPDAVPGPIKKLSTVVREAVPATSAVIDHNAQYVDDNLCADCHSAIFESYQKVAMAQSFYDFDSRPTIESFAGQSFFHEPSGNFYEMRKLDGQLELTRYKIRPDGSRTLEHRQTAAYVVGSGNHVRTYLFRNDAGEMFQLPVVWYSQDKKWGMAPGYDRPDHPDFSRPITRQCLFCHNAYPEFEPGTDRFGMPHRFPEKLPQGIGCQRCHGPGSQHILISERADSQQPADLAEINAAIINPAKLPIERQDDVCNQCHLQPMSQRTSLVRHFDRSDYDFHAGHALDQFMVYFEPDRNNDLADHFEINHHPYRLHQSDCFIQTPGGIRCTHCHDPHVKIAVSDQLKFYQDKCFACHGPQDCADRERGRLPDAECIACHMPQRRTSDVIHVTMTDHKISRRPTLADPTAPLEEINVPIDMPIRPYGGYQEQVPAQLLRLYELFSRTLDDDLSAHEPMAAQLAETELPLPVLRYQWMLTLLQNRRYEAATPVFDSLANTFGSYSAYHTNLGIHLMGLKKYELALERLEKAVAIDPLDASAWYHIGLCLTHLDRSDVAIDSFQRAIQLRPTYVLPRLKLGSLYGLDNQLDHAAEQFQMASRFDPRNIQAHRKLSAVYRRQDNWSLAFESLNDGLLVDSENQELLREISILLLMPDNKTSPQPETALRYVRRWRQVSEENLEAQVLYALALSQDHQPQASLTAILPATHTDSRKPEAGLIMAMNQHMLGATESAKTNYAGARQALNSRPIDSIGRLVQQTVEAYFQD